MIANRVAYGNTLIELAKNDSNIVVLDVDVGRSTGTLCFKDVFPERYIDCGIAEQNMMCVGAGLAASGMITFAATFAVFTSMRAVEQIRNAICYNKFNVKIAGTHAGLETGADGATHQAIEDIAIMRSIPNIKVFVPASPNATIKLTKAAAYTPGPVYLRFGKAKAEEIYNEDEEFPIGGSKEVVAGDYVTVFACGSMVVTAIEAAKVLKEQGKNIRVIDMYSIKPIHEEAIIKAAKETKAIITIEDHNVIGGLGGAVCEITAKAAPAKVIRFGVNDKFGCSGSRDDLYKKYGLVKEKIVDAVNSI